METQRAELKDRLKEALDARNKKPADLSRDLKIPKSAISQYLSGKVKDMDTKRFYEISNYLGVSEAWLMGYNVDMERTPEQKKNDNLLEIVAHIKEDDLFYDYVMQGHQSSREQIDAFLKILAALSGNAK